MPAMDRFAPAETSSPASAMTHWIKQIQARYEDRITGHLVLPARLGEYAEIPGSLPAGLHSALAARGIRQLYLHQRQAWDAATEGRHVVIATPTASGKTLCYNLPVMDAVLREQAKALYLFPTKALAQDQLAELLALNQAGSLGVRAATFDGDTPSDVRTAVRLAGDIVVSNPDMLHQGMLPHHTKWARLFESLRYVVIDEVHSYRGIFGSHLANVLRRLKRICAFYGSDPVFILCSATIGNPRQHAEALIGAPVEAITASGAPQGERHVLLWNPPVVNRDLGIRASARSQVTRLARMAIRARLKALVFAPSRLMVEVITKYLKDVFDADPRKPARIHAYRGGYLPLTRRATEQAMRVGCLDGIVSTSALELGVDIGALDVALLCGYPGSIAGCWQRLGRAGRRLQHGGLCIAGGARSGVTQVKRKAIGFRFHDLDDKSVVSGSSQRRIHKVDPAARDRHLRIGIDGHIRRSAPSRVWIRNARSARGGCVRHLRLQVARVQKRLVGLPCWVVIRVKGAIVQIRAAVANIADFHHHCMRELIFGAYVPVLRVTHGQAIGVDGGNTLGDEGIVVASGGHDIVPGVSLLIPVELVGGWRGWRRNLVGRLEANGGAKRCAGIHVVAQGHEVEPVGSVYHQVL